MEQISKRFAKMLEDDPEHAQYAVEGLAYASTRPSIKEQLAHDKELLKRIVRVLASAPPKSPLAFGALSIFVHLTRYQPTESEEQKRLRQLKAYANAAGKLQPSPLNDDAHVAERCKRVFEAGITPVLVARCNTSSVPSLSLIISILFSLSATPSLRGQLAQQGAVRLLLAGWSALPGKDDTARRTAAQTLARILISTNPTLVFRQLSPTAGIRPLASIITPDPTAETRDLLPTFESLLALTNLASTDDDQTRHSIVRTAWDAIEEQLFSTNTRVSTAAVELVCNIVQDPRQATKLFGSGSSSPAKAATRIKVILALADADDDKTRSAAGGALASLSAVEEIARGIVAQPRGAEIVLGMCRDEDSEGLRHRGAVVVQNLISHEGDNGVGKLARERLLAAGGVEALTECAKKSRTPEVVQAVVHALEGWLGGE
jgi:hypothetical protein